MGRKCIKLRQGEAVQIGGDITVFATIRDNRVHLTIEAPREIPVDRVPESQRDTISSV